MRRPRALADDLWLITHDLTGTISPRLRGLGLGTALLAEMADATPAWMWIKDGAAHINPTAPWHEVDDCLWEIAFLIWEEQKAAARQGEPRPGVKVADLLQYLSGQDDDAGPRAQMMLEGKLSKRGTYEQRVIGDPSTPDHRIVREGRLAQGKPPLAVPVTVRHGLLRTKWVHEPLDSNVAGMPASMLNSKIRRAEYLTSRDIMLIALLDLTDITRRAEMVGTSRWPGPEQCRLALPPHLGELLDLADDARAIRVMR
jgi:hypothetical protein